MTEVKLVRTLQEVAAEASAALQVKHAAREASLQRCRETIRASANSIRASHRQEFVEAEALLAEARAALLEASTALRNHPEIAHAGFLQDAQKEYAEAWLTLSFIARRELPTMGSLGVGVAPYLNGLAEAASELRRYILDALRRDDLSRVEDLLGTMDEVYALLVTMDFPDAITLGLRRTTDALRAVLERTRSDVTMSLRQRELTGRLEALETRLRSAGTPADGSGA